MFFDFIQCDWPPQPHPIVGGVVKSRALCIRQSWQLSVPRCHQNILHCFHKSTFLFLNLAYYEYLSFILNECIVYFNCNLHINLYASYSLYYPAPCCSWCAPSTTPVSPCSGSLLITYTVPVMACLLNSSVFSLSWLACSHVCACSCLFLGGLCYPPYWLISTSVHTIALWTLTYTTNNCCACRNLGGRKSILYLLLLIRLFSLLLRDKAEPQCHAGVLRETHFELRATKRYGNNDFCITRKGQQFSLKPGRPVYDFIYINLKRNSEYFLWFAFSTACFNSTFHKYRSALFHFTTRGRLWHKSALWSQTISFIQVAACQCLSHSAVRHEWGPVCSVFGWKIPGLSSAMNSAVASHVTQEVCHFWKRDFRGPGTKASKAVTPTGGPVVAGAE